MKRQRSNSTTYKNRQFKKPRRASGPVRAYNPSRVPMASRGYRINSQERKVVDTGNVNMDANTTGSFQLLNATVPGTDMTNRIGRKIMVRSIQCRAQIELNPLTVIANFASTLPQTVRFILFVDYQPNGATPVITDILSTASALSPLNLNNRDRFKVLRDKQWVLGPLFIDTVNQQAFIEHGSVTMKMYKKCMIETVYNAGSAGTVADINSGAVYAFFCGTIAAGALDSIAIFNSRVRFDDK